MKNTPLIYTLWFKSLRKQLVLHVELVLSCAQELVRMFSLMLSVAIFDYKIDIFVYFETNFWSKEFPLIIASQYRKKFFFY